MGESLAPPGSTWYVSPHRHVSLRVYLSIYLPIYLRIYLSIYPTRVGFSRAICISFAKRVATSTKVGTSIRQD